MSFLSSLDISKNALSAQRLRMDVITQNISNAETTRTEDGTPYRRQMVVFEEKKSFRNVLGNARTKYQGVQVAKVVKDDSDFKPVYDPSHPDADENGYVLMPNVDQTTETLDMMAATRSYEANLTALNAVKSMAAKALQIGK